MFDELWESLTDREKRTINLAENDEPFLVDTPDFPEEPPSHEFAEGDYVVVETGSHIDSFVNIDTFSTIENFVSDSLADLSITWWYKEFINRFAPSISNQDIIQSVKEVSDFFHIDEPLAIREDETTGVFVNDDLTPLDDVLIFSKTQLQELGLTGKASLDLVMTHEGTHRMLQGLETGFSSHQEELCCDYMAGVRAGLNSIDVSQLENALSGSEVSVTHPGGSTRVYAIEEGRDFAVEFVKEYGVPPTFDDCLAHFKSTIGVQNKNLALESVSYDDAQGELKGFVDDKAWHEKCAQEEFGNANYHRKEAERATNRGDFSAAKDHISRANSCDSRGKDHMDSARRCSK